MLSTDEVVMGRPGQHEGPGLCLPADSGEARLKIRYPKLSRIPISNDGGIE
jgi:hypothetical protein